ncbi:hypothetical protein A3Q56_00431 [Intoshia linei]|uniref:Uncharacterized protein n=1 Tax=Intoshia linei TaxID=1819745 RepID=A0A177BDZ3_9BILA|nr:hypothetical protein A3Q56_00431 [Intoshia linei]
MEKAPYFRHLFRKTTQRTFGIFFGLTIPLYTIGAVYLYRNFKVKDTIVRAPPYDADRMYDMMRKMGAFQYVGPEGQIRPIPGIEEDDE